MADVRLTAINPADSSAVPVACNEKGELKLEDPLVIEGPQGEKGDKGDPGDPGGQGEQGEKGDKGDPGDPFSGNFVGNVYFDGRVGIGVPNPGFSLEVQGLVSIKDSLYPQYRMVREGSDALPNTAWTTFIDQYGKYVIQEQGLDITVMRLDGGAPVEILQELTIRSRNATWLLAESGGLCHLIEQSATKNEDGYILQNSSLPPLRNIPAELTMVEEQLQKVLEKLRMVPEAGWEVWDGSA